jgi:LysR family transcriptional regulator, hydrogen peroxide-inducible genes activator
MEMHQLRYAVAVARTGTFSRAAEQCHVSQPSLSQQILKLEEELGERLFDRTKREARPTPHGEAFLRRAIRILEEVDAARREAEDAKQLFTGSITIGVIPTIAPYLLPRVTALFTERFPGVEVVIHEEPTGRLLKLLHGYEVDLAVLSPPFDNARLEIRELFTEELKIALPPGHPLVLKRSLHPRDLDGERLIILQEGHCLGDQVLGFCARGDHHPKISFRSAQLETLQSLVHAGMGISLVPEMALRPPGENTPVYRAIDGGRGKTPSRTVAAAWPKQRPPGRGATEFLKLLAKPGNTRSRYTP